MPLIRETTISVTTCNNLCTVMYNIIARIMTKKEEEEEEEKEEEEEEEEEKKKRSRRRRRRRRRIQSRVSGSLKCLEDGYYSYIGPSAQISYCISTKVTGTLNHSHLFIIAC